MVNGRKLCRAVSSCSSVFVHALPCDIRISHSVISILAERSA